jgi:micrococcal nuclease
MRQTLLLLVLAAALCPAPADARERTPATRAVASGTVHSIVDGDTLVLKDGVEVRLVGLQAPKLPLGRTGFRAWPLAEEAKAALEELALGKTLRLSYGGLRIDRHGRLLAHLHDADGRWIQGEMLARGMARVYSFADNRARVPEMLALETAARAQRRGIWAHPFYRIRGTDPDELKRDIGTFQLVEGIVLSAAVVRNRGYLNFGPDWKTDFTITISPRDMRRFRAEDMAIDGLKGHRVRVRGWIGSHNGPVIDATHPEQIELLP